VKKGGDRRAAGNSAGLCAGVFTQSGAAETDAMGKLRKKRDKSVAGRQRQLSDEISLNRRRGERKFVRGDPKKTA